MSDNNNPKQQTFKIPLAFATADLYLVSADQLKKQIHIKEGNEKKALVNVTIFNLAFAIEIYLKSFSYITTRKTKDTHDLSALWKQIDMRSRKFIIASFDNLFDSENEDWKINLAWGSDFSESVRGQLKIREFTAEDVIKAHRHAFEMGRYAYEDPIGEKVKVISYNITSLVTLSWIVRSIARHFWEEVKKARKKNPGVTITIAPEWPKNIAKFP